jgi:uncharacterized protein
MRTVFVDTWFWVALSNNRDEHHALALELEAHLDSARFVTTDAVLLELLGAFAKRGSILRVAAHKLVEAILENPNMLVIPQRRDVFLQALVRYGQHDDKGYSLADCISMATMDDLGIREVLTYDQDFVQAGYTALGRQPELTDPAND